MTICTMPFTRHEEIESPCQPDFWQHFMPDILHHNDDMCYPKRETSSKYSMLLMGCECRTFQLVADGHFMIPVIKKVIQTRNAIQLILDGYFHIFFLPFITMPPDWSRCAQCQSALYKDAWVAREQCHTDDWPHNPHSMKQPMGNCCRDC